MYLLFSLFLSLTPVTPSSAGDSSARTGDSLIRKDSISYSSMKSRMPLNRFNFNDSLQNLYAQIGLSNYNLSFEVFRYGMIGYYRLRQEGKLSDKNLLTIIDFTKSSSEKRFYTIDLDEYKVKYYTYTSHGKNTGEVMAAKFSNTVHSNQSSLGFYVTGETYIGSKGFSLKLDGKEGSFNDKMRERGVVIHEADYVSEAWIKKYGRLGRSFGCPALPKELSKDIIHLIKDKTPVFAYFNDETYLSTSSYLDMESLLQKWEEQFTLVMP